MLPRAAIGLAFVATIVAGATSKRVPHDASICPSRTVNYITHSLAQQCLATARNATGPSGNSTFSGENHTSSETEGAHATTLVAATTILRDASAVSSFPYTSSSSTVSASSSDTSFASIPPAVSSQDPSDDDSLLESSSFMSFEDWKRQNLRKAGQSEHVGRDARSDTTHSETRKRPTSVHNALDSLGDDAEIDIDFSGLVPNGPDSSNRDSLQLEHDEPADTSQSLHSKSRSKDAGTTCKERFNYASFDCAANILKTNREARNPSAVLVENKDAYMLNECSAKDKYMVLELCNDLSIDTVVLANFEFFSSTFRTFRVSVSDRYPVKADKWLVLGTYEARNTREVQAFLVENPIIWARYLRIEFLTHYGSEFYCPMSLVRVHGTTMLEEYKHDQEANLHDDVDEKAEETTPEVSVAAALQASPESSSSDNREEGKEVSQFPSPPPVHGISSPEAAEHTESTPSSQNPDENNASYEINITSSMNSDPVPSIISPTDTCAVAESPSAAVQSKVPNVITGHISSLFPLSFPSTTSESQQALSVTPFSSSRSFVSSDSSPSPTSVTHGNGSQTTNGTSVSKATYEGDPPAAKGVWSLKNETKPSTPISSSTTNSQSSVSKQKAASAASGDRSKPSSGTTSASSAAPTMQESFFKSVQKRLQMLEANSSLSLQYIEDQSRSLRDAFKKVEQRQLAKTTFFLDQLNSTVLNELREFRKQYDQLWQSTVIELELQRERYERDNAAINARLGILADEVIFQRRLGILQMVLILGCLALVLFSRGSIHNYLELPLVQNVLARSPSTKWLNLSGVDSPAGSPKINRTRSAHQLRVGQGILKHRRSHSDDSVLDTQDTTEIYAPPTPVSYDGQSDMETPKDDGKSTDFDSEREEVKFDDPPYDAAAITRPSTSPPVLSSSSAQSDCSDVEAEDVSSSIDARLEASPKVLQRQEQIPQVTIQRSPSIKQLAWNLPPS